MTNNLEQYNAVKSKIRPGDLVVFWGRGPLSYLIRLFASGPSHSAVVRQPLSKSSTEVTIVESTIENGKNGVQTALLGPRIAYYGPGDAACLRLRDDIRRKIDWFEFYEFVGACQDHVRYDISGLFEFLLRELPIIGVRAGQAEHQTKMVCSAWVVALLEKAGVLTGINWSKVSPQDIVEMNIFEDYLVLLGNPKLNRFNTV